MATHLPESEASAYQMVVGLLGCGFRMRRLCTLPPFKTACLSGSLN
jgi:outer membrane lipopolysaccharide assembly protein LptE/RlpB